MVDVIRCPVCGQHRGHRLHGPKCSKQLLARPVAIEQPPKEAPKPFQVKSCYGGKWRYTA